MSLATQVRALLIPPPIRPAEHLDILMNYDYVALADINVTNYKDYLWADTTVVEAYAALKSAIQWAPWKRRTQLSGHVRRLRSCSCPASPIGSVTSIKRLHRLLMARTLLPLTMRD